MKKCNKANKFTDIENKTNRYQWGAGRSEGQDRGSSPPGSSVHGILQLRVLEWVAMPSSRGSS